MMPIRDVVIFPHMMTPFVVGRDSSVRALEAALAADRRIFLATQHDATIDDPKPVDIFQTGTIVNIVQSLKLPDGNIKVLVEGQERARIMEMNDSVGYYRATVKISRWQTEVTPAVETAMQKVTSLFEQYVKLCQSLNYETMIAAVRIEDPARLTDTVAANLQLSIEEKQEILELFDPLERLNRIDEDPLGQFLGVGLISGSPQQVAVHMSRVATIGHLGNVHAFIRHRAKHSQRVCRL